MQTLHGLAVPNPLTLLRCMLLRQLLLHGLAAPTRS
jgi:hypothetical protein